MHRTTLRAAVTGALIAVPLLSAGATGQDPAPRVEASRAVVQEFMQQLKGALQQAMQSQGPVEAIAVCHEKAPQIAADMSAAKGWDIGRTSLKLRNPSNAPDGWERAVLEDFERRKGEGASPAKLEHYEFVEQGGERVFRYMKAIPTGDLCLVCHGENISEAVQNRLAELYPQDQATGFKPGDIRGAFTVLQPVER
jgi:hypothetical protein